jgi:DmsE family decaheme c-type cytochrome
MRRRYCVLWILFLTCSAWTLAQDTGPPAEDCAACHEDTVAKMADTPHAAAPGWDHETSCSACHGNGEAHMESGGELDLIIRPGLLSSKDASKQCLACHSEQASHFKGASALHRLADVSCQDCHNPHASDDLMLTKRSPQLCADCHQGIVAQFEMPRTHPVDDCASCHNPHGSESLRTSKTLANQTCGDCHTEKGAPYIYAHDVALVDGCSTCHTVHGSSNRHLLTYETQVNLCYQCHSASVTPTWHSVPRFLNEKCTACHTAIHGSNTSPYFLEE